MFPQTAPTDDAFFNRAGLERIGVIGQEIGLQALDVASLVCMLWMWHSSANTRKEKGRRGLRPWPLQCLSQFLAERKDRLFRGRMFFFLRTFYRWGGLVFIVYVIPNWRVVRILSHWMGYFLPLSISDLIRDIEGVVY